MINIRRLESELWESADLLRAGSKLTSNQYCMPVLGIIFLRYAYSRFKMVETEIIKGRPSRGGRVMPIEASDFVAKSALFLPKEAQYDYLLNLPNDISTKKLLSQDGHVMMSLGEVVNNAMQLIENQSEQLTGVLPRAIQLFLMRFCPNFFAFLITVHWMKWVAILLDVFMNTFLISLQKILPLMTVCSLRQSHWLK